MINTFDYKISSLLFLNIVFNSNIDKEPGFRNSQTQISSNCTNYECITQIWLRSYTAEWVPKANSIACGRSADLVMQSRRKHVSVKSFRYVCFMFWKCKANIAYWILTDFSNLFGNNYWFFWGKIHVKIFN